jgi:hypothetical protein
MRYPFSFVASRSWSLALLIALVFFAPVRAEASPTLEFLFQFNPRVTFGTDPVYAEMDFFEIQVFDPTCGPPFGFCRYFAVDGTVTVESGALIAITPLDFGGNPYSLYEYGGGTFTLDATWIDGGGVARTGGFTAALDPVRFMVSESDDGGEGRTFFTDLTMGAALLDQQFAALLGVPRAVAPSSIVLAANLISGDGSSPLREGVLDVNSGYEVQTVPAPTTVSLLGLAALSGAIWRRRK